MLVSKCSSKNTKSDIHLLVQTLGIFFISWKRLVNLLHINDNIGLDKIWKTVRSLRSDMLYHIWDMNTGHYKQSSSENLGKSKSVIILKLVFCMPMWWLTLCCVCNKVYLGIAHPPLIFTQCKSFLLNMHFLVYSKQSL